MAKLDKLPPKAVLARLRGKVQIVYDRGIIVAKKWPRKRPGPLSPATIQANNEFKRLVTALKDITPQEKTASLILAHGTGYAWRDVMSRAMVGRLVVGNWKEWAEYLGMDVQDVLNQLAPTGPAIIFKTNNLWVAIPIGEPGTALVVDEAGDSLTWQTLPDAGITELTGAVLAGPGSGTQEATLSTTGVTPGTYDLATIEVTEDGRIVAAASGDVPEGEPAFHPGFASSRYYATCAMGTRTSVIGTANTIYATPFYVPTAEVFTAAAMFATGTGTSSVMIGVYANSNGAPAGLEVLIGQLSWTAASGKRELTGQSIPLDAGWHWLATNHSANQAMGGANGEPGLMANLLGQPTALTGATPYIGVTAAQTFSAGNLPATFPTPTFTASAVPLMYVGK